ncbi:hypothetical protein OC845_002204 [Tilletia horrida]|nr:hypothetical protein OC845_002204 [Tilletia horrida]
MAPPTSKNKAGLGHAIINRKAKDAKANSHKTNTSSIHVADPSAPTHHQPGWVGLRSITAQSSLDEFLSTAQLAQTDFTAERRNITVVSAPGGMPGSGSDRTKWNPYLLSDDEERNLLAAQRDHAERLRVPRRPEWDQSTTPPQLASLEAESFLDWRRSLAILQDGPQGAGIGSSVPAGGFVLTPFERNIEVWRQLWRVVERSHLIVQIVDARNPLRFRCEDLEKYVAQLRGGMGGEGGIQYVQSEDQDEGDEYGKRRTLLLINKSDLLDYKQRRAWADYFDTQNIQYAFFSAARAAEVLEQEQLAEQAKLAAEEEDAARRAEQVDSDEEDEKEDDDDDEEEQRDEGGASVDKDQLVQSFDDTHLGDDEEEEQQEGDPAAGKLDPRTRVLTVSELEELFLSSAPPLDNFPEVLPPVPPKPKHPHSKAAQAAAAAAAAQEPVPPAAPTRVLTVGLVGYPNVGKSSTINALLGSKKVSVSATPGKTKHFQTLHLSPEVILCDCPGLVFPQFATTSAELIVDGVLPIDQMREYTAPAELVAKRIPKDILEGEYGFPIDTLPVEEGGTGEATGLEVLSAYARARGFVRQGQGNPDESRSARYVLKDYVNARLLYCHPPPRRQQQQKQASDAQTQDAEAGPQSSIGLEEGDADEFNAGIRDRARRRIAQRRGRGLAVDFDTQTHGTVRFNPLLKVSLTNNPGSNGPGGSGGGGGFGAAGSGLPEQGAKSRALDSAFFRSSGNNAAAAATRFQTKGRIAMPGASIVQQGRIGPDGRPIGDGGAMSEAGGMGSKKHFKSGKRNKKVRSGAGFD